MVLNGIGRVCVSVLLFLLLQKWRRDCCVREWVWERKSKSKSEGREREIVLSIGGKGPKGRGHGPYKDQNDCDRVGSNMVKFYGVIEANAFKVQTRPSLICQMFMLISSSRAYGRHPYHLHMPFSFFILCLVHWN